MTTIPNNPTLSGCYVLIQGTTFLSKQIILHNKIIAKLKHKKPLPYTHSEFLLWWDNQLWTIGARAKGTEKSLASDYYVHGENICIMAPRTKLTSLEEYACWNFFQYMDPSKYQYSNFVSYINYIHTFGLIWLGRKGGERNYCYKLTGAFTNFIHRWKGDTELVTIYDLYENPYYKPLEDV